MIKLKNIIFAAAVATLALGCNPVSTSPALAPDMNGPSAGSTKKENGPDAIFTVPNPVDAGSKAEPMQKENDVQDFSWKPYKKDDPIYRDALALIKVKGGKGDTIDPYASGSLGPWYFIVFKEEPLNEPFIYDLSTTGLEPENTYLVDMKNQNLVMRNDWDSFAALAKDLNVFGAIADKNRKALTWQLAEAASLIAFGNTNYLSIVDGQKFAPGIADPLLSVTPTHANLVYFILGTGERQSTTRCEVTFDQAGKASFQHAPFGAD